MIHAYIWYATKHKRVHFMYLHNAIYLSIRDFKNICWFLDIFTLPLYACPRTFYYTPPQSHALEQHITTFRPLSTAAYMIFSICRVLGYTLQAFFSWFAEKEGYGASTIGQGLHSSWHFIILHYDSTTAVSEPAAFRFPRRCQYDREANVWD